MLLFILIIVFAFSAIGKVRQRVEGNKQLTAMAWAMGVALFIHVVNFFGVAYFGQISVAWYSILALIGSTAVATSARRVSRPVVSVPQGTPYRGNGPQRPMPGGLAVGGTRS